MGKRKLTILVQEDIDEKFREAVFKRKGMKKGNIGDSIEEAMLMWIGSKDVIKRKDNR